MALNVSYSLVRLVNTVFDVLNILIIIRVVLSWVRPNPYAPGVRLIYRLTEPILAPFRGLLPSGTMGVDFSPLIALLVLQLLRRLLLNLLIF